jgi:hypothetical protein
MPFENPSPTILGIIVVTVLVLLVVGIALAFAFQRRQRSKRLRERFGPEYDYTLESAGSRREAEQELKARQERVRSYDIRSLEPDERERFAERWRSIQRRFVDEPGEAVAEARHLVTQAMEARGFPTNGFEDKAADLSVYYPEVVVNYRDAHRIVIEGERAKISTEDLRQAMVHYRSLFKELVEAGEHELIQESR